MRPRSFLVMLAALLAFAACQVKTRTGVDEALNALESDVASMRRTSDGGGWNLDELEARARRVALTFGQGDPRWHRAAQALARIREVRRDVGGNDLESELDRLASEKLSEVGSAPPAAVSARSAVGDMAIIDEFVAQVEARRKAELQQGARPRSRADAELDRPWMRNAATGDRGREEDPVEQPAALKPRGPLEVVNVVYREPYAIAYITFAPGERAVFGAVSGDFLAGPGKPAGRIIVTFVEKGFEPNWEDIYSSQGKPVTGGAVAVDEGGVVGLVAIGRVDARPASLQVELRTSDARSFKAEGP